MSSILSALLLMMSLPVHAAKESAACKAESTSDDNSQWILSCRIESETVWVNFRSTNSIAWRSLDGVLYTNEKSKPADLVESVASISMGDGLAKFLYAQKQVFVIDDGKVVPIEIERTDGSFYVSVRHAIARFTQTTNGWQLQLFPTEVDSFENHVFNDALYSHLWDSIAILCLNVERFLVLVAGYVGPFVALVLFALLIRLITFPLNRWGGLAQERFNALQAKMQPELEEIKQKYKGAERSEKTVALYRAHDMKPLTGLKGSVPLLIQLPILIAVFNVTSVSALFQGAEILWITDLSLPDRLFSLNIELPILGSGMNLLPILLGFAGWIASRAEGNATSGLFLHVLITLLCYSLAAAVVLYWVVINVIQILEKKWFGTRS